MTELPGTDSIDELCKGQVDATALIIGHPSSMIARALNQCNAELVPLAGPEIDRLISGGNGYGGFSVPSHTYASLSSAVASFAVRATVVTLSTVDDDVVEAFVGHTLANLDVLKQKAPFLAELDPTLMRSSELSAPLHAAAMRAFENRK